MTKEQWLEQRCGVSFLECVETCLSNREFVAQWERLWGKQLFATHPLDQLIDEATGYSAEVMREFCDFVHEAVFIRLS